MGLKMRNGETPWTSAAIDLLRELVRDTKLSADEIAQQIFAKLHISFTRSAIIGKCSRLKLKLPRAFRGYVPSGQTRVRRKRSKTPQPPTAPIERPIEPIEHFNIEPDPVSDKACCWPIGHPGQPDFIFCDRMALVGKPYCAGHCRIAYVPDKGPRRHVP